jgi:hypothetical protein
MPPVGFEATILASERPQTHALDRAATGIDTTFDTLSLRHEEASKTIQLRQFPRILSIVSLCVCATQDRYTISFQDMTLISDAYL